MKYDKFVNLHHHDTYSTFDGCGQPEEAAEYVAELNQYALAQTNHGNVTGLLKHYYACKEVGIKPILGCEIYFVLDSLVKDRKSYHMTILCKNDEGYSNLMKMITEANETGFYYKPRVDVKNLLNHSDNLVILSGCQNSIIYQYYIEGHQSIAEKIAVKLYKNTDFYLEIQPHNIAKQREANKFAYYLNSKYGIPLVMTCDSHYARPSDARAQFVLRKVKFDDAKLEDYAGLHLHSRKSVEKFWYSNYNEDCTNALDNTVKIAKKCDVKLDFDNLLDLEWNGEDRDVRLKRLALNGLKRIGKFKDKIYRKRLAHEISVVIYHGFEDVFLATEDMVTWANNNGIQTGPGRGSGVSSLLAYCLGITKVDPIEYDLLFERFLRKDKKKMPDIDVDFDSRYRDKVFRYLNNRHVGSCAQVISYGRYQARNLMNDIAKVFNIDDKEKKVVTSLILETISKGIDVLHEPKLKKYTYVKYFAKLFKNVKYFGTHASGVAICKDMTKYVALVRKGQDYVTCYDLNDLEMLGILKMDVLGLNTISITKMVEEKTGCKFKKSCLEDEVVYSRFSSLDCRGIFQFNSRTAREVLTKVSPDNILELSACSALNRPAPLKLGVIDDYVDGKEGLLDKNKLWYKHSKDSFGCLIYQEQVMKTVREVAGFNWDLADKTIKNLGSGDRFYKFVKEEFIKGAIKTSNMSKEEAEELHLQMVRYLFNKSHAVAYTVLSAYQMWQMVYYPLESIWAILANSNTDDGRKEYEKLAVEKGFVVLLAHVNGKADYSISKLDGKKVLMQGIKHVKGVGANTANIIEENGPYKNVAEMKARIEKRVLRKNVLEALEEYGSLLFKRTPYIERCIEYNTALLERSNYG